MYKLPSFFLINSSDLNRIYTHLQMGSIKKKRQLEKETIVKDTKMHL